MFDLATFQTAVANFLLAAGWALEFTNGSDTHTFNTTSGPKKSFAKAIKDFDDAGDEAISEFEAAGEALLEGFGDTVLRDDVAQVRSNARKQQAWANMGVAPYANLADANAEEGVHNVLWYDTTLNKVRTTV